MNIYVAEDWFWSLAHQCAAFTSNPLVTYEALKKQYTGIRPDAPPAEYEAAMQRLTDILGV